VARRRKNTTKDEIIRLGTKLFLEKGYTVTSPKMICDELDISTGNLTYYFPTKDHLLAVLVDMLCDFQWKMMEKEADEGLSSIMAICLELATMAAACESDEVARDFFLSAYTSPMCLSIIRENDTHRAKSVFKEYCTDWTDEQFAEAELMASGIEYATLMNADNAVPLETRIVGALNVILGIYSIPEETRKMKITRVLGMDYRSIAARVLQGFRQFVADTNEQALADLYKAKGIQKPISPREETT